MTSRAAEALACPVCGDALHHTPSAFRCPSGHAFDVARQGYVNLLTATAPSAGDSAAMVAARADFLAEGHYAPIAYAVARLASDACDAAAAAGATCVIADVGAGTGYYLAAALDAAPEACGIAVDLSKYASRRAASAHPRAVAVVADAWNRLPLRDHNVTVLLDIFSPRNAAEFSRVLAPGGTLVVVTPGPTHLQELVGALGLLTVDPDKEERLVAQLGAAFERTAQHAVGIRMSLDRPAVRTLVGMGPSAWHVAPEDLERRLETLVDPTPVTLDVVVSAWRVPS